MFYRRLNQWQQVVDVLRCSWPAYFVVCATVRQAKESVKSDSANHKSVEMQKSEFRVPFNEGLLLYYDRFSFYSQKVVMALHEKNLPFKSKFVNLIKGQQYQSWFLNLNPRGEVPVLQDGEKLIPDSARIIDYLEDNFTNENIPRLIPMDEGPEVRQKVTHFRHVLQKAPEAKMTTGAMLNQHLIKNPKAPFYGPVRRAIANAEKNGGTQLREYAEKNPEAKEVLLAKAAAREERYKTLLVEQNFREVLEEVHHILDQVEEELSKHTGDKTNWWLCSNTFTIADVELAILLVRISQLGLEYIFWSAGRRPHIEKYYERVKMRDSFKKTIPGTFVLLKTILMP